MTNRTDNFTRADTTNAIGTPSDGGSAWIQQTGVWGISGNAAYESSGATQASAALQSSIADVNVQATLATLGSDTGIFIRGVDANNYIILAINSSSLTLYRQVSGGFTSIGSFSGTISSGDVLKLTGSGSTINAYQNGTLRIGPVTETTWQTQTLHGLRTNASSTTRFDDFSIVSNVGTDVSLTGVQGTMSVGTFGETLSQNPGLTGVQGTVSLGTFTEAIGPTIALVGVQGDVSVGTFGETLSSNTNLTGVQVNVTAGGFNNLTAVDQLDGYIFQRVGTTKNVPFSGTYAGTLPVTIEVKLINIVGGTTAQDWTALTGTVIAGGAWSGNLLTPQGGGYHFLVRTKDAFGAVIVTTGTSANYWAVGRRTLCIGQSNMWEMVHFSDTPPTPNVNTRMFYDIQGTDPGSWQVPTGNGTIQHANVLNNGFGIPIAIMMLAVGGTTLANWLDLTAGSVYELAIAHLANAGTDVEEIIWAQGEFDIITAGGGPTSKTTYKAGMATLYARLLAVIGRAATACHMGTYCLGNVQYTDATDASAQAIREAHLEWSGSTPGAFFAGSAVDMVRIPGSPPDAFHWQTPYYQIMANRYGQASLHEAGLAAYGADGMKIAYARGALASAIITLGISQFGGTGLKTADGGTSGAGLTAIEISDDGFATTKTIVSTAFSGSSIVVTLSAALADPRTCSVRYQYGENPDISVVAYDNTTPGGGTLGLPLQPTDGVIAVTLKHRRSLPSLGVG